MPTERVVEVPWMLTNLPQSGKVLDIGSCGASYLADINQIDRELHCLDPQDCTTAIPSAAKFYKESIIGNSLQRNYYDCVVVLSTLEHIGLPFYDQAPFEHGDKLALAEVWDLLRPAAYTLVTVPAGRSKITSWYRQYSPKDLQALFAGWKIAISYWGYMDRHYIPIEESAVEDFDYREVDGTLYQAGKSVDYGAGALACIMARRT